MEKALRLSSDRWPGLGAAQGCHVCIFLTNSDPALCFGIHSQFAKNEHRLLCRTRAEVLMLSRRVYTDGHLPQHGLMMEGILQPFGMLMRFSYEPAVLGTRCL